jgi:hypothetical protein
MSHQHHQNVGGSNLTYLSVTFAAAFCSALYALLENVEVIYGAVRAGAALMFYPEVNVIFKAMTEQKTGTPAYKRVPIAIYRNYQP